MNVKCGCVCVCVYLTLAFCIYLFSNDAISRLLAYLIYGFNYILITSCSAIVLYMCSNPPSGLQCVQYHVNVAAWFTYFAALGRLKQRCRLITITLKLLVHHCTFGVITKVKCDHNETALNFFFVIPYDLLYVLILQHCIYTMAPFWMKVETYWPALQLLFFLSCFVMVLKSY